MNEDEVNFANTGDPESPDYGLSDEDREKFLGRLYESEQERTVADHGDTARGSADVSRERSKPPPLQIEPKSIHPKGFKEALSPAKRCIAELADEIFNTVEGRGVSTLYTPRHFICTAKILTVRGFKTLADIKRMKNQLRSYLIDDLKKSSVPTEDVRLLFELFEFFPPTSRANVKNHEFEELCIPIALKNYSPDLSKLVGVIKPDQPMTNAVMTQLTTARNTIPPYEPFVLADLSSAPWRPPDSEHKRAHEAWKSRVKGFGSKQAISLQAYLLYTLRFVISADICGAWARFGGLSGQLSLLAVTLNLAITDSAFVALEYDIKLRTYLAELARERSEGVNFSELLSTENVEIKRRVLAEMAHTTQLKNASKPDGRPQGKGVRSDSYKNQNKPDYYQNKPDYYQNQRSSYSGKYNSGKGRKPFEKRSDDRRRTRSPKRRKSERRSERRRNEPASTKKEKEKNQ